MSPDPSWWAAIRLISVTREALDRTLQECKRDEVLLERAFDADTREGDTFGSLSRYEAGLERTLYRRLSELRQLQDQRQRRNAPPVLDGEAEQVPTI